MTLRFAVIGTGAIGREHIRRCSHTLVGASVVAVNDIDPAAAARAVDQLQIDATVYEDPHALIRAANVDAVLVTSWGPSHEEFVLACIAAGKPVFCEKPLATTAEACRRIVEAEVAHGKRLVQVGFMRSFDEGFRQLKQVIDAGQIGAPLMVHAIHRNPQPAPNYQTSMGITDTLIHELDGLRWLLEDDYKSVQVVFPRSSSQAAAGTRDPQIILLETRQGIRIDVEVFVNCRYGYDVQCQVVGETGVAALPEPAAVSLRSQARFSTPILTDWKDRFIAAYDVELQFFIDALRRGEVQGPSAWDGYAAAVAADACVKAQASGAIEPVELPERPAFYNPH
ncbi:Gfo/Idh/MocA family oxidoreductase [Pseudomonas sp. NPDC007930]|uniref:Gfo/Idh/MocA family oxidoreductase n=1 Tax=Pseudomonas sp. NPDC007930 TaxID=3364417 RepID=UPI0036E3AA14